MTRWKVGDQDLKLFPDGHTYAVVFTTGMGKDTHSHTHTPQKEEEEKSSEGGIHLEGHLHGQEHYQSVFKH